MINKERFLFTEEESRGVHETWGWRAVACYEQLKEATKLIQDLIIENQGLKLNQDLSVEFGEWLQDYEEPIYNIRKLFQQFLKERNENKI